MPPAPTTDDELLAAAQQVVAGINANVGLWVNPPITTGLQTTDALAFQAAMQDQVAKKSAAELATDIKIAKKTIVKANLARLKSWAEGLVGKNDPRLNELGFSAPAGSTPLELPGQPGALEACGETPAGEFKLEWRKPGSGGKVAGYQILRKLAGESAFSIHATATSKSIAKLMTAQPVNIVMQFRLVAFNDAGVSVPSNTVEVKL